MENLRSGNLVEFSFRNLESSVTQEMCFPILTFEGLQVCEDFIFVASLVFFLTGNTSNKTVE